MVYLYKNKAIDGRIIKSQKEYNYLSDITKDLQNEIVFKDMDTYEKVLTCFIMAQPYNIVRNISETDKYLYLNNPKMDNIFRLSTISKNSKMLDNFVKNYYLSGFLYYFRYDELKNSVSLVNHINPKLLQNIYHIYNPNNIGKKIDEYIKTNNSIIDNKDNKDKKPEVPTGVEGKPLPPDVTTVKKDIEHTGPVKSALSKIDTADEFRDLILQMSQFVSANLRKDKASLKSALFAIANMLKAKQKQTAKITKTTVQEDYSTHSTGDIANSVDVIEATKSLAQHLLNINDRREFADLIFSILPFIDPQGKITQDKTKLANIIFAAASKIDKFVDNRDKEPAKKSGGLS
jgi:hypothetical protein